MELQKIFEEYKWYDGEGGEKHLSASSLTKEPLELWLKLKNYPQNKFKFSDSTLGSVAHLGVEHIIKQTQEYKDGLVLLEKRIEASFCGWTISGKPDMVDMDKKVIYDYKFTKNYSKKMLDKDKNHAYIVQLSVYRWLLQDINFKGVICWFMKDSNAVDREPTYIEQEVELLSFERIEEMIKEKINILEYLGDEVPSKCEDTWTRNIRGKGIISDVKCKFYCSYSDVCPRFRTTTLGAIQSW